MAIVLATILIVVVLVPCVGLIPAISLPAADVMINSNFFSFLRGAAYFFPCQTCAQIISTVCLIGIFRICIAIPKTILDLLPVV